MIHQIDGTDTPAPCDPDRAIEVYRRAVRSGFAFLKRTRRLDDLLAKSIPLPGDSGFLAPVCDLHAGDVALIAHLARWRAENAFAYPSQFPVTEASTADWLRTRLLDVEDRLLFLVLDPHGHPVGHLGFAHADNDERAMEVDNVVRGVRDASPGIMAMAMQAM